MYIPGSNYTQHLQDRSRLNYTPAAAVAAGEVVDLGQGILGAVDTAIAANRTGAVALPAAGIRLAKTADATAWAVGDEVWLVSGVAVQKSLALDPSTAILLGLCIIAKAANDGANSVAYLPLDPQTNLGALQPVVYEFDCDTGGDTDEHILIPASQNRAGLLLLAAWAVVTEVFAGATEDQGIVTIEDEDDNALSTLTPSDGSADAVGDIIVGTNDIYSAATGDAAGIVAAGKAIQGFVSQQTSGAGEAGKMKVYLRVIPLL